MGWSSWNNFDVRIDENMIKAQADIMAQDFMKDAGYQFINIDDGFWGGRDSDGSIKAHPQKFPSGMKSLADYIHSKGLKAGIYSDAGANTCASMWNADTIGVGMGLFNHERDDLHQMLVDWGYDFIKVDWCGGEKMGLDEEQQYTRIGHLIKMIDPHIVYNICRWQFPGKWATQIADSWRISGDIRNNFSSILRIIDLNTDLWRNAGPGHVNDMDMLQVGRGMSYEEDKAHFSMWSILCSPLLLGNDLRSMSDSTIEIITNKEVIALNQDPLVYQARKIADNDGLQVWGKPLGSTMSGEIAVALLNRTKENRTITFTVDSIGIESKSGYQYRDLWQHKTHPETHQKELSFQVPSHGVVVLKITGAAIPFNIFQKD